ncbi:hypothetical protein CTI14_19645, partial [Methylobacterium radiotolerans]
IPVPRSISYAKLEQADMEQFHDDAVAFLRTAHAQKTMWPQPAAGRAAARCWRSFCEASANERPQPHR